MARTREPLPRRLWTIIVVLPLVAAFALPAAAEIAPGRLLGTGELILVLLLAIAAYTAQLKPVRIGPHQTVSLAVVPGLVAALLEPSVVTAGLMGVSALASDLTLRRSARSAAYNGASIMLATLAASLTASPSAELGAGLDWKTSLQELTATASLGVPEYAVTEEGPDHAKLFTVEVLVGGRVMGRGQGRNKKQAELDAARRALETLGQTSGQALAATN